MSDIVLVTGCFDVLHRGHFELISLAARLIGRRLWVRRLWVGINSDAAVRRLKGPTRPINCEDDRAYCLERIKEVEKVLIIDDVTVAAAIRRVAPAVWCKGGDYTMDTLNKEEVAAANEVGAEIVIIPRIGNYSTTHILSHN